MAYTNEEIKQLKKDLHSMEYENTHFYPIEDGLEDDLIRLLKFEVESEDEKRSIEDRLESYFYDNGLNCRKRTSFLSDGFEFYVTNLEIKNDVLNFIMDDLKYFNSISVFSEIDGQFSALNIKVYLDIYSI